MNFKRIRLEDIKTVNNYLTKQNSRMSDYSGGALYIWADYLETEYYISEDTLFLRFFDRRHDHFVYAYPVTQGDIKRALFTLEEEISLDGCPFVLAAVPFEALPTLAELYSIDYHFKRDWSDYLYDAEQFRSLRGKKFHDKRNHISRFKRDNGEYTYESITGANLHEAIEVVLAHSHNKEDASALAKYERKKAIDVLNNLESLNLVGGIIKTGGKAVAISAGELQGDTLFVHIEKALREYNGAFTLMANEFAKRFPEAAYINREDDAGEEGLRKSKLSYNPIRLVDKYIVNIKSRKQ